MTATAEKKPEYTEDLFAAPIKITVKGVFQLPVRRGWPALSD